MTLIACISPETHPVLLGDALFSTPVSGVGTMFPMLSVPHAGRSEYGLYPKELRSKLLILSDSIIAAYAGNVAAAKRALTGVAAYFRDKPATGQWLINFLEAEHRSDLDACALLFSVKESSDIINTWGNKANFVTSQVGQILADGTGAERLGDFTRFLPSSGLVGNALERNVTAALYLQAILLADEIWTGQPMRDSFGGLYDIVTFNVGRPIRFDDYMIVFWAGEERADHIHVSFPFKLIHRYTTCGTPAYHCAELDWNEKRSRMHTEQVIFLGNLLDELPHHVSRHVPKLRALCQVHVLLIKGKTAGTLTGLFLSRKSDPAKHPMVIEETGKKLEVRFNREHMEAMFAAAGSPV